MPKKSIMMEEWLASLYNQNEQAMPAIETKLNWCYVDENTGCMHVYKKPYNGCKYTQKPQSVRSTKEIEEAFNLRQAATQDE